MQRKRIKRAITLIEIMVVILLIGLIGGALAFNMHGSLDKGKVFKTEQNIARVHDILMLEYAQGNRSLQEVITQREDILRASPLLKNGASFLKDGWGNDLIVQATPEGDLSVSSSRLHPQQPPPATRQ